MFSRWRGTGIRLFLIRGILRTAAVVAAVAANLMTEVRGFEDALHTLDGAAAVRVLDVQERGRFSEDECELRSFQGGDVWALQ